MSLSSILQKVEQKLDQKLQPGQSKPGQGQASQGQPEQQLYQGYPQSQNQQQYGYPQGQQNYHPDQAQYQGQFQPHPSPQPHQYNQPPFQSPAPSSQQSQQNPSPPQQGYYPHGQQGYPHSQPYPQYPQSQAYSHGPSNAHHTPAPPQSGFTKSTKKVLLTSSGGGTHTFVKEPDTKVDLYTLSEVGYSTGGYKSESGLDYELRAGDKKGKLLGGYTKSDSGKVDEICIGNPKLPNHKKQKLQVGSSLGLAGPSAKFVGPDGREYGWTRRKGADTKMSMELKDSETGEVIGTYEPWMESTTTKMGTLEFKEMAGADKETWELLALTTGIAMARKGAADFIGKEVFKAFVGAM